MLVLLTVFELHRSFILVDEHLLLSHSLYRYIVIITIEMMRPRRIIIKLNVPEFLHPYTDGKPQLGCVHLQWCRSTLSVLLPPTARHTGLTEVFSLVLCFVLYTKFTDRPLGRRVPAIATSNGHHQDIVDVVVASDSKYGKAWYVVLFMSFISSSTTRPQA